MEASRFQTLLKNGKAKVGYLLESLEDLAQKSPVLGVRQIFSRRLPWWHRLGWALCMGCSLFCLYSLVAASYGEWQSPPLITLAAFPTLNQNFPLPAASVCSSWQPPPGTFDLLQKLQKNLTTKQQKQKYLEVKMLCGMASEEEKVQLEDFTRLWDLMAFEVYVELFPTPVAVFANVDGFCITVNMATEQLLRHDGERFQRFILKHPRLEQLERPVLNIVFLYDWKVDKNCKQPGRINAFPHDPNEYPPAIIKRHYTASLQKLLSYRVNIDAEILEATEELREVPLAARGCYFPGERRLELFKEYTRDNCLLECRVLEVVRLRGCKPFGLPGPRGVNACTELAAGAVKDLPRGPVTSEPCDCLSRCTETRLAPGTVTPFDMPEEEEQLPLMYMFGFTDYEVETKVRTVRATVTGFLANCAGLFGVFLGMSFLTIFEVVYQYLTEPCTTKQMQEDNTSSEDKLRSSVRALKQEVVALKAMQQVIAGHVRKLESRPHRHH